jgi:uncharacterized protein YegL
VTNKLLTDITLIVDASPSMQPQTKETIQGVNAFVKDQLAAAKAAKQNVRINLVTFSNYVTKLEGMELNEANYRPAYGNGTALYDAVGQTISETGVRFRALPEESRPGKVLVVIVTDGEENSSRIYHAENVKASIKNQTDEYAWDFVFMGANQDAWLVGSHLGFNAGKVMSFAPNDLGVTRAFASASSYAGSIYTQNANQIAGKTFTSVDLNAQSAAGLDIATLAVPDAIKNAPSAAPTKDDLDAYVQQQVGTT